ncbi:MAG: TetR/AcrR family transcriptional regulator [bacterium]
MSTNHTFDKREKKKKKIIDTAKLIVTNEGINGLSIRKIAKKLDCSPGIIYHYFTNKNEIIEAIVKQGYSEVLQSIHKTKHTKNDPEESLKEIFSNYINEALKAPEEFKIFMLNEDPNVLKKTSLLKRGISKERESLQLLCNMIEKGITKGRYIPCDSELTAQIIWTSTFGLIIKLIIEKDIQKNQIDNLIERHFTLLFNGLRLK